LKYKFKAEISSFESKILILLIYWTMPTDNESDLYSISFFSHCLAV